MKKSLQSQSSGSGSGTSAAKVARFARMAGTRPSKAPPATLDHRSGAAGLWQVALAVSCALGAARGAEGAASAAELEEVTVTATRRETSVLDVPYNITAQTAEDLRNANVSGLADLARQVAGMTFVDLGVRSNGISNGIILRGINAAGVGLNNFSPPANELTVTTYLDETPVFTNLKIADVQRVEVLRGPQGTLYGAGAVGGTIRFIFNKPDPEQFSASVQTKLSSTAHSENPNYGFDGVLNIPLAPTLAFRVAAGYEKIAGVIDATNLLKLNAQGSPVLADPTDFFGSPGVHYTKKGIDEAYVGYARASLLWKAADGVDLQLTYHGQRDYAGDFTAQNPYGPARETTRFLLSPNHQNTDLYALTVTADLGFATLTSSSSYTEVLRHGADDSTNFALAYQDFYAGFPRVSSLTDIDYDDKNYVQELRLASKSTGAWDWVAGVFYSHFDQRSNIESAVPGWSEYTNTPGHPTAVDALGPGATWAQYYQTFYPGGDFSTDVPFLLKKVTKRENLAAFGELTYHLTHAWQVTGGARAFHTKDSRFAFSQFRPCGDDCNVTPSSQSSDHDQIFKLNTSYVFSPALLTYATWAQGFRPGGENALPPTGPLASNPALVPFKPDTATNWELGAKGNISKRLQYTVDVFRIDWKNVQLQVPDPISGIPAIVNGGQARSQGAELSLRASVTENLQLSAGYAFTDAKLTRDFFIIPGTEGFKDDRLPGTPRNQVNAAADYFQPLAAFGGSVLHYRLDGTYRSDVNTALHPGARNYALLGGFTTLNAGVDWSDKRWRVGIFVNNLTDRAGVSGVDHDFAPFTTGSLDFIQRPRTIGLTVGYATAPGAAK